MTFTRDELHTLSWALMVAIMEVARYPETDGKAGTLRAEHMPRMRALLDRFQN